MPSRMVQAVGAVPTSKMALAAVLTSTSTTPVELTTPNHKEWVSFEDLFNNYKPWLHHSARLTNGAPNNTLALLIFLLNKHMLTLAKPETDTNPMGRHTVGCTSSEVDHRFILAVIMQEVICVPENCILRDND
jgi:starvation-inducible outer membrane lipoprotein